MGNLLYTRGMNTVFEDQPALEKFGEALGRNLQGGEVMELIGDVGAGKTTLTKAIARGLVIQDDVQSPSFTISRVYEARDGLHLCHYDFYRLEEPGIMAIELAETLRDHAAVTIVEWANSVAGILPDTRLTIRLHPHGETGRELEITTQDEHLQELMERIA